ncbi:LuxR C-terminal-related transcriptional regulator [Ktedonobacter sp. SOSP1-52]|uniref:LuxR C-terminal-related transcriptional regulator n=1 Tax=Ktedonobacter sp. SOSP1-52 TaxID=2778366 RepID=UPI0019158871|nr:LuxR C-terminal-related transcriptional regulator [Ktedonobacter sp. SOSP1-52]
MSQTENKSPAPPLATKFVAPQLPLTLVSRPQLLKEVDAMTAHRLALLSSSAGSGKTTLISTWARSAHTTGRQVAWLSLDALDNDPTRFWTSVIAALRTRLSTLGSAALHLLHSPQPAPLSTALTILINELLEQGSEMILVLDDYHIIEDQVIHESLTFLLDHVPANLHLVLVTRVDPDLPLARWRMRGQMVELRDPDLAFRQEETACFLTQVSGDPFQTDEIQLLQRRTEGWIAGLQLAALALRKHNERAAFLQAFTGSHRYLMDYVQQEILKRLPVALQQFLLQIAVLPRMNAELCQAVTEEPTSQELLETLERQNLFLVPLDTQRHWYRLHDLFREILLAHLQMTQPARLPTLHERAARWYEQRDEVREALAHWLAAGNFSQAVALMERVAESLWLGGEVKALSRWVMVLPDRVVHQHPHLVLITALYLLNSAGQLAEGERLPAMQEGKRLLARVEAMWQRQDEGSSVAGELRSDAETALLQRRMRLLRWWIASFDAITKRDPEQLHLLAAHMQQEVQDEEILWQMVPLSIRFVLHQSFLREGALLFPEFLEAEQCARASGNRYARIKTMQWLAFSACDAGRLHQARQVCLDALDLLSQIGEYPQLTGYFSLCLANVSYQWNHLEEARGLARHLVQQAAGWQQVDLYISGLLTLIQIELAAGQLDVAQDLLQQAEEAVQRFKSDFHQSWLAAHRIQYWLAVGNLEAATNWATRRGFFPLHWQPWVQEIILASIRVLLAQQQFRQALAQLESYQKHFERPGSLESTLNFLALFVVALAQAGRDEQARVVLRRLLSLTKAEGFLRLYLDEGEPMRCTLQDLQATLLQEGEETESSPAFISTLLEAFEQEAQRRSPRTATSSTPRMSAQAVLSHPQAMASPHPQALLIEPLSLQEQRVLRLLVAGRSNPEIARELVVSVNTVKTQVQSIYRKLGVTNRVEASTAARDLHLL